MLHDLPENLKKLIINMFDLGMIKFGAFTLKSGKSSYVYADVRTAISHPEIFQQICDVLYSKMIGLNYKFICGVPYSGLAFASAIAYAHQIPMLLNRKEAKDYGTKKMVEGHYQLNDSCLIIEDVVTTGMSILTTIDTLNQHGLKVTDIVCLINRNQDGDISLANKGYKLHSIIDLYQIIDILLNDGKITKQDKQRALDLI